MKCGWPKLDNIETDYDGPTFLKFESVQSETCGK